MEIKTKFNIGDMVFVRNKFGQIKNWFVYAVRTVSTKQKGTDVWYDLNNKEDKYEDCFPESRVFKTIEECKDEVAEHERIMRNGY